MKQRAWLEAVPDTPEQRRILSQRGEAQESAERVSRGQRMFKDGVPLPLPEIQVTYLVDLLFEIGPVVPGGMCAVPLRSEHLMAWQDEQGATLEPWESRMLRRLSHDYLAESQRAEKHDCPQPWTDEIEESRRERIAAQVRGAMRSLK